MESIFMFIEKISVLLMVFVVVGYFFISSVANKKKVRESMHTKLLLIKVPKEISQEKSELNKKIAEMISNCDQMISNFNKFKYPIIFEVVSPNESKEISFYVACHKKHVEIVQKTITAYFPFADVLETNDYTIFAKNDYNGGWVGKLASNNALPIKTYQNFESDSFSGILNAFSKIDDNEGMALQIVLSPVDKKEKKNIQKILEDLKKGKKEKDVFKNSFLDMEAISESFKSSDKKDQEAKDEPKIVNETLVKSVESKLSQSLYSVNVRLLISCKSKERVEMLFNSVQGGFMQLTSPVLNLIELKKLKGKSLQKMAFKYIYRIFDPRHAMILNSSEINTF